MDWFELFLHYFSCRSSCMCDTKIKEEIKLDPEPTHFF